MVLKTKLWVFLKQAQPKLMVNQHKSANCMGEEEKQEKQKNKAIKDKIIIDIRNCFEKEEEDYYKPVRVNNFWSNNYSKYKNNVNRSKTLSTEEYLNKIRSYLKDIINDLKTSDTWKI